MQNLRIILIIVGVTIIIVLLLHSFWISHKERSKLFIDIPIKHNKQFSQYNPKKINFLSSNYKIMWIQQFLSKKTCKDQISKQFIFRKFKSSKINKVINYDLDLSNIKIEIGTNISQDHTIQNKQIQLGISKLDLNLINNEKWKFPIFLNKEANNQQIICQVKYSIIGLQKSKLITKANKKDVFIVLHIAALKGKFFSGKLLLNSIFQLGFQFGEKQIFHRYVDFSGSEQILFSLANMVKPGFFNPESMYYFTTPGVSIFMIVPSYGDSTKNFKLMLQTAQNIAANVGGVVLDENYKILTNQMIEVYNSRIVNALD